MNAELRLLIDCCRSNFARSAHNHVDLLPAEIDWSRFQRLVRFHRVQGLAWNALELVADAIPEATRGALAADARATVAANLQMAMESARLRDAFDAAGVPLLFVKGLTVGALVYRNPLLKTGWDIDVLVPGDRLTEAAKLLERLGYGLVLPSAETALARWHRTHKDSLWRRADPQVNVELHPRLVDNPSILPGVGIESPTQDVEIVPGVTLPTLAPDELFAYLCVHGASSAWFRLKWIADLAGLVQSMASGPLDALYRRSQKLGAARAAGQALLLADALFGTLDGSPLRAELSNDRGNVWLASAALKQLARNTDPVEPTGRRLGTWRIHATQLLLRPGLRFKAGELARQLREMIG